MRAALLLLLAAVSVARGETPIPTCATAHRAALVGNGLWRCSVVLQTEGAYLMSVPRQDIDISLELIGPDSQRVLKVDSPARRAGSELLFYRPRTRGAHVLELRSVEARAPSAELQIEVRHLNDASADSPLTRGLAALTAASAVVERETQQSTQQRLAGLRNALTQLNAANAPRFAAEALVRTAGIYYWTLSDAENAAATAQEAAKAFDLLADPLAAAQARMLRAAALIEMVGTTASARARPYPKSRDPRFVEAEQLLEGSALHFKRVGSKYDHGHALNNLGLAYYYQGEYEQARSRYLEAAQLFRAAGEVTSELLPLQNIAALEYDRGNYVEAVNELDRLRRQMDPASDATNYVEILNNLGTAQYALGNTDAALDVLLTALPLTENSLDPATRARTLHALGRVYAILGDEDRATVLLEQALELRRSVATQDRRGLLISLIRVGDLERERGMPQAALRLHLEALEHAVSPQEKARALRASGLDHMVAGSVDAAIQSYERALKLELPEDSPDRIAALGAYGHALLQRGSAEGAALLEKAAQAHQANGSDELCAQDYYLLASALRHSGQLERAQSYLAKALALFESQRVRAVNPDLRATYVANRAAAYALSADIDMALAARSAEPVEVQRLQAAALLSAESLRVRAFSDFRQFGARDNPPVSASLIELDSRLAAKRHRLAALADQQNPSQERMASLRREIALLRTELDVAQAKQRQTGPRQTGSVALSMPDLQRSVESDSVLLTWLLTDERSWIWCITRDRVAAYPLGRGNEVEKAARDLHALWSQPVPIGAQEKREHEASRSLLGDAQQCLRGKRTVIVVADAVLRAIPLGALWVANSTSPARRLAETHLVSYRPMLGHWDTGRPPSAPSALPSQILLVGDPVSIPERSSVTRSAARRDERGASEMLALPGARREIATIAQIATGWRAVTLVREQATKTAVLAQPLETFRVLHFATHARLDVRDPQLSAIVLSGTPAQVGTTAAALSLREVVGLELNADTVVLSACEGSLGKEYRGQLSLGLSESFLLAGARNVVGGLWPVADAATERYMQLFYEQYVRFKSSPQVAAQTAARAMMNTEKYAHPFYWAAFVVVSTESAAGRPQVQREAKRR